MLLLGRFTQIMEVFVSFLILHNLIFFENLLNRTNMHNKNLTSWDLNKLEDENATYFLLWKQTYLNEHCIVFWYILINTDTFINKSNLEVKIGFNKNFLLHVFFIRTFFYLSLNFFSIMLEIEAFPRKKIREI